MDISHIQNNATMEKRLGTTPGGGSYSIIAYFDSQRNLTEKQEAVFAIVSEYTDEGKLLLTTYVDITKT